MPISDELKLQLWWLLNELQRNDEIPRRYEVREILTPLVSRGLIRRVLSQIQAHNEARRLRIPKREVKVWEVMTPVPSASVPTERSALQQTLQHGSLAAPRHAQASATAAPTVDDVPSTSSHQIYLGNIHYSAEREDLIDLLSNQCEVIALQVPAEITYGSKNRGFAFATIGYDGTTEALISKLERLNLLGRQLVVRRQLPKISR